MSNKPMVVAFVSDVAGAIASAKDYARSILGVGQAAKSAGAESEKMGESGADAGKKTAAALRALGIKSEEIANKQISKLRKEFEIVRDSGVASANEIARAQESMERRIKAVNDSIGRDTRRTFEKMADHAKAGFGKISGRGLAMAGGLAGGVSVGGAVASVSSAGERAREIDRAIVAAGLRRGNTDDLLSIQRLAFAANAKFGMDIGQVGDILKDTNDKLGDFVEAGSGGLVDFAEQIAPLLGVNRRDYKSAASSMTEAQLESAAKKAGMSVDDYKAQSQLDADRKWRRAAVDTFQGGNSLETLTKLVAVLEKIGASEEQKAFYLEAVASESLVLGDLLRGGGTELNRLGDVGAASGGYMMPEDIEKLQKFNEEMAALRLSFDGVGIALAEAGIIDNIKGFVDGVASIVTWLKETAPWLLDLITKGGLLIAVLTPLAIAIGAIAFAATTLWPLLAGLGAVIAALGAPLVPLAAGAAAAALAVAGLWQAITEWIPSWLGGGSFDSDDEKQAQIDAIVAAATPAGKDLHPVNLAINGGPAQSGLYATPDAVKQLSQYENRKATLQPASISRAQR